MPFLIVPHAVDRQTADLWIGALDVRQRPGDLELRVESADGSSAFDIPLSSSAWQPIDPGGHLPAAGRLHFRAGLTAGHLAADRAFTARLMAGGTSLASADFRTLPERLPLVDARPFTVLLGSCFCVDTDREGMAGLCYRWLPLEDRRL